MRLTRRLPAFLAAAALAGCNAPDSTPDEPPRPDFNEAASASNESVDDLGTANAAEAWDPGPAEYRSAPVAKSRSEPAPARPDPGEWVPPKKDPPPKK